MGNHPKRLLKDSEVQQIFTAALRSPRNYLILRMYVDTGMRLQELLLTEVFRVDMESRTIHVPKERSKNREEQYKMFTVDLLPILNQWITLNKLGAKDRLFDLSGRQVERIVKEYAREAGIPDWKDISPHYFRHWHGTRWWIKYGDPVLCARMLGQKSIQQAYLHNVTEEQRKKFDTMMSAAAHVEK